MPGVMQLWSRWRRRQFLREYRARRERYARLARDRHLVYDPATSAAAATERARARGHTIQPRRVGEIHTLAFVPRLAWHGVLIDELSRLGPLSLFDYTELGISSTQLYRGDAARRLEMNAQFVRFSERSCREHPVDWVFLYGAPTEISAEMIQRVQDIVGAPVVGMCLDDKNSWEGPDHGRYRVQQKDLVAVLDLAWTSARVACEWYLVEGGRPLYLPEGCSPSVFRPIDVPTDIDVSFVGQAYGFRPSLVRQLRKAEIDVRAFGEGWPSGPISFEHYVELLSRSRVNLGHGGIGYSPELSNVKGRDFEIPCAGGGVYLTTFNADLAQHFVVGEEILCYRDMEEAIELIRYYLAHDEERRAIAVRGRRRCLRAHTWTTRFLNVLAHLNVVPDGPRTVDPVSDSC